MQLGFVLAFVVTGLVLGRDDHGGGRDRQAAFIAQRDLALGVGFEERGRAGVAVGGHALEDLVAVIERRRHQVGGLVGRIAEHDPLVARAFVLVARGVDALRDMGGLAVQPVDEFELLPVEAVLLVADVLDHAAHGLLDLFERAGSPFAVFVNALAADFARQHHQLGGGQGFAGDARLRILRQEKIDNGIRDLVRDLVRMAFGNAFGSEQIIGTHRRTLSSQTAR